jgi:FtsP/CotA-like multicopper oxidase with cupredoxin domain
MKMELRTLVLGVIMVIVVCVQAVAFVQTGPSGATRTTRDHLAATDGFIVMPDGRDVYTFGFTNVSSLVKFRNQSTSLMGKRKAQADFAGPTIKMSEGRHHYLTLSTLGMAMRPDLFDPHTVHFHGYPHASAIYDGEPMSTLKVNQGADFTYFYQLNDPGTYMYHCHNEATEHMEMGMLGNLVVYPRQDEFTQNNGAVPFAGRSYTYFVYDDCDNLPNIDDPLFTTPAGLVLAGSVCGSTGYDVNQRYFIQFADIDPNMHDNDSFAQPLDFAGFKARYFTLNGRGYPDTTDPNPIMNNASAYLPPATAPVNYPAQKVSSLITINQSGGASVAVLSVHNLSIQEFVDYEIPGLPVQVIGRDAKFLRRPNGKDLRYYTNSILLGPGESADLRIDTTGVQLGTYYMYSRMLEQLTSDQMDRSGAMTEIRIQ